jgi:hypothetical protein
MRRGSSRILLIHFQIYPNMFQQVIAIIRGSWFPQKLLEQSVLWMYSYMDYDPFRVVSCQVPRQLTIWTGRNPYTSTIQTARVASEETTTP